MTGNGRVAGKSAIVTGAASPEGMGFAIARALSRQGARVVLADLDPRVEDRATELENAFAVVHDVTDEAGWARSFAAAGDRIDILVNNAGVSILKPVIDMNVTEFERQLSINLTSAFIGCKLAISAMRAQGTGGSIVNVGSLGSHVGMANGAAYSASKGGMRQLTKSIALEYAREGIRCNAVHPGLIRTEIHAVGWRDNPTGMQAFADGIPMGHMGEPDDIAQAVLYLASDEAKFVTGVDLLVDGGSFAQ